MSDALGASMSILVFITREYEKKVNSGKPTDNCCFEFNSTCTDEVLMNGRISLVMDPSMRNTGKWKNGRLKHELGSNLYIDLANDFDDEPTFQSVGNK
jgi:hypothetical protein